MIRRIIASATTALLSGAGTIQLKIPGTFSGLDHDLPGFSGRSIISGSLWFAAPAGGDRIVNITRQDLDGVIPVEQRAAFPDYPILNTWIDTQAASGNQGMYFEPTITRLVPPDRTFIPSQIYLVVDVQKGSAGVDTVYVNLVWDDLN